MHPIFYLRRTDAAGADNLLALEEIARTTRIWGGEVVNLQVVETNEQAVQLRALVSARTQETCPTALPKQRAELIELERPRRAA